MAIAAALAASSFAQSTSQPDKSKKQKPSGTARRPRVTRTAAQAATSGTPLRLRAVAVDPNNPGGGSSTGTLDIVIERWSSDAERDRLRSVLQEQGGGDALLKAVQKIKPRAGFVRTPHSLGWDIQFARETTTADGTRRIVLGSDRPISFWEASARPRSADYEFMLAEIHIDTDGRGQGRLAPAAMVTGTRARRRSRSRTSRPCPSG